MLIKNYIYIFIIIFYSFFINWFSANLGVLPIDTFGFFDTGYGILKGQLPIKDYWAYTGLTVDYFQSFFFLIFGNNWNSYIIHSSFINVIASLVFYYFLIKIKIPDNFSIIYSLSFATLLYPVSGTPFAYLHAYIFSLIGIMLFFILYNSKNSNFWALIPIIYFLSFFSMQTPTIYILALMIPFIIFTLVKEKNFSIFKQLIAGSCISIIFLFIYLYLANTLIKDFIYQYFLFPITIAEGRITSDIDAYVRLIDQLNLKRVFGDFKFIHLFLIPLIFIQLIKIKNKKIDKIFYLSLIFIFSSVLFIYNQLLQANQIYIFSLVPVLAAILHRNTNFDKNKFISFFIIGLIIFVSVKFHIRYNVERKFIDLEHVDKSVAFSAKNIHNKLDNLKWISRFSSPSEDEIFLEKVIKTLKNEKENTFIITHYQFFSTVLDKSFYLLNRWYIWDNNSHPTENHKYFDYYKEFVLRNFEEKEIKVIYLIGEKNEFNYNNIKNYFDNKCFDQKEIVEKRFIKLSLKNCI